MLHSKWTAAAAALTLAAGTAEAQINFGSGCAGASGTTPTVSASSAAAGSSYTLSVTGPPTTACVLIAGFSNTVWSGLPLPFDLSFLPAPGCSLNVSADLTFNVVTDVNGDFSASVPSGAAGGTLYWQVFALDLDPSTLGGFSDGLEVTTLSPAATGDILITEIFQNPNTTFDSAGECMEVHNPGGVDIDINGWTIRDDDFDSHVIDNGGPLIVPAGGYAVLGVNADMASNGNIAVDYAWGSNGQFFLSNSSDEVVLQVGSTEVDRVNYDNGATFPDPDGASMSLDVAAFDATLNDDGANWTVATCTIAGGPVCNPDFATMGSANDMCGTMPCPVLTGSGDLIFSEIMQNPAAVSDTVGEWFEIYNTTASDIDMMGYTITAGGSPNTEVIASSVIVPAGGYALFARTSDPLTNGGLPAPDYDYDDGLNFGNGTQNCSIRDASSALVCETNYDNGATFPDPTGASMTLNPTSLDCLSSGDGSNWCEASSTYGDGDFGTPGAANDTCP